MLNLISNGHMQEADRYTLKSRRIESLELMEDACKAFVGKFIGMVQPGERITVFCGKGNNGGDGLAVARLLRLKGYLNLYVYIFDAFKRQSDDFSKNLDRLKTLKVPVREIREVSEIPDEPGIVIDAVLGSGYHGELNGFLTQSFSKINSRAEYIVSVDCPSGWYEGLNYTSGYSGIRASVTISFQRPKLAFIFPESVAYTRSMDFVTIGLDEDFIRRIPSDHFWIEERDVVLKLKKREPFSHKGTYGHVLIIAGAEQTMGAAVLCGISALFTGAGLVTACIPGNSFATMNISQPEIMTMDAAEFHKKSLKSFDAVAIGPGLGTGVVAKQNLKQIMKTVSPVVFDADALNILASEALLSKLPAQSILTPHMKEFDRLFGIHKSWEDRLETARRKAVEMDVVIVLKNRYSFVCNSDGKVYVNPTGNPSMAQGGMGDVLTGCIAALAAQGYNSCDAAIIGCYVHGKSGDELSTVNEVNPAGNVARHISKTLKKLNGSKR